MLPSTPTPKEIACVAHLKEKCPVSLLDEADCNFLTENTYLRFARSRNGDCNKAEKLLTDAINWRKSYKPYAIAPSEVSTAMKQLTMTVGGRCHDNRPIIVLTLAVPNECEADDRIRQLIFVMEETQRKGYDTITWIINFGEMGKHHKKDPQSAVARKETMRILQEYYPERLGLMLLYNPPWYVRLFMPVVRPFMDSRTWKKMFNAGSTIEGLEKFASADQIPEIVGGKLKKSPEALESIPFNTEVPASS